MDEQVLLIGSSGAGLQAAIDLADAGLQVILVESSPFIGADQNFGLPAYQHNTLLLEILKHPRIRVWTSASVQKIRPTSAGFQVLVQQNPRFIDLTKCTACGDCVEVCPVTIPGTDQKAIHFGGEPGCAVIQKEGISPCSNACPAGIHVQGYVALINQGSYQKAYDLIQEALPFPSVCGRVCNHLCETACSRAQLDEAVNLMALKRFVSDWSFEQRISAVPEMELSGPENLPDLGSGKQVAVIGAGPAGLTAARDLARKGHHVKVFDAHSVPGGMMRVGIPPHRLNYDHLAWEIDQILSEGIELQLNTWVDDIPALFRKGYDAVLVAAGAGRALKPALENSDHPDNWLSLEFLKKVALGKKIDLSGREVIVLGGGDVAMDAARAALRLGSPQVKIICRGLRASQQEHNAALEEGIQIIPNRVFQTVALDGKQISGVVCLEAEVGGIVNGKRQFTELPGTDHLISGDLVIWALGQAPDSSFLPGDDLYQNPDGAVITDLQGRTPREGLFAAGDFRMGMTTFVVDAVAEGHQAAAAIHAYLLDLPEDLAGTERQTVQLTPEQMRRRLEDRKKARSERKSIPSLAVEERISNFAEVDLTLGEKDIVLESSRCLICGPCSECLACIEVCQPRAIDHYQSPTIEDLEVKGIVADRGGWSAEDIPGVIFHPARDPLAGSAAAFEVIKALRSVPVMLEPAAGKTVNNGNRTGLVLCQCGGEISRAVDTAALREEALAWPEIHSTHELAFSCTADAALSLKGIIREERLGKLVLAACSCCSLDQVCYSCTFQRVRCKDNLGIFGSLAPQVELEFINIREQCAWVHRRSRKKATDAARVLIRAGLTRQPASAGDFPPISSHPCSVLVVGSGASAESCLTSLAEIGLAAESLQILSGSLIRSGGRYRTQGEAGDIEADCLILAPGSGAELDHLSGFLKLNNQNALLTRERLEGDTLDFGLALCPLELDPVSSGKAAAARIYAWNQRTFSQAHPLAAAVDWTRCRACATCQEVCGYGIPELIQDQKGSHAVINPYLCHDCGICTAHCPSGAIRPAKQTTSELNEMLEIILT